MKARILLLCSAVLLSGWTSQASAAIINWNIDSSQSWIRLNLPANTATAVVGTIQLRDQTSTSAWTDAGGRRSNFGGTVVSSTNNSSHTYLSGLHNADAIEFGAFRPNPASFDPNVTSTQNPDGTYMDTSTTSAAFAVRARLAVFLGSTTDAAFVALKDISYDMGGTIALTGGGGNYTGSGGTFGIESGLAYVKGSTRTILGNEITIPDIYAADIASLLPGGLQANTGALTITNLGGLDRQLNHVINIPIALTIDDVVINGSITGNLRAFATIPEPASLSLVGIALSSCLLRRRRC